MNKEFSVDWDDSKAVINLANKLFSRAKILERSSNYYPMKLNGKMILPEEFDSYQTIFSSILNKHCSSNGNFYVYAHCNPLARLNPKTDFKHLFLALTFPSLQGLPFYIGKGTGNRAYELSRNDSHRKVRRDILNNGNDIAVTILYRNLDEESAFAKESALIDLLGIRAATVRSGLLCNLDEGSGALGRRMSYLSGDKFHDNRVKFLLKRNGFDINSLHYKEV